MAIPDSGKIAVGVIAGVVTIGLLHVTIFRKAATEYQSAKSEFENARNEFSAQQGAKSLNETYAFRYTTLRYTRDYWDVLRQLNLTVPDYFFPSGTPEGQAANARMQEQAFIDLLADLERRRDDNKGPKLTFLESQWDLRKALPENLQRRGINIEDIILRVQNTQVTLGVLDKGSELYKTTERDYVALLNQLGLDLNRRAVIEKEFGKIPATLYTLNRIQIVLKALPKDYFKKGAQRLTDEEVLAKMYEWFRLEWPKDADPIVGMFNYYRQSQNLRILLDLSEEKGLEEISALSLLEPNPSVFIDPKAVAAAQPKPKPTTPSGTDPRFREDGGAHYEEENWERPDDPKAGKDIVANGAAFRMTFTGSNIANMNFLHAVSTRKVPLELDAVTIEGIPKTENAQRVTAFVNGLTFIPGLFRRPSEVQTEINTTLTNLLDVAKKGGARELAIKDGLIDDKGNPLVTVEPTATPAPPAG